MDRLRQKIAASRFARGAALPGRVRDVAKYDSRVLRASAHWLARSREHTNYTFELHPLNIEHLAWWVSGVAGVGVDEVKTYMAEVQSDGVLYEHIHAATVASARRGLADDEVRLHKRIGWYALVRALRPTHVVETGTDKGLGSVVLAAALLKNGAGRLTTIDVNPASGYLISGPYAGVVDRQLGNSLTTLSELVKPVDLFLHDSLHTREHEAAEFDAVEPHLAARGVVVSDNSHATDALPAWASRTGRTFYYWQERPLDHWYPGGGIGLAK